MTHRLAIAVFLVAACGSKDDAAVEDSDLASGDADTDTDADADADADADGDTDTDDTDDCVVTSVELTHLLAQTAPDTLPFPLTGVSDSTHFLLTDPTAFGPDDRLYFYADYNLQGYSFSEQFTFFAYQLDSLGCAIEAGSDLDSEPLVGVPVMDPGGLEITQAARGGAGDWNTDLGINIWDLTSVDPIDSDCGPNVPDSVDYTPMGSPFILLWQYEGWGAVVRDFRIYVGHEVCA